MDSTACELDGIGGPKFVSEERRGVNNGIARLDACFGGIARSGFDLETVFALVKLETERFVNVNLRLIKRGKGGEDSD